MAAALAVLAATQAVDIPFPPLASVLLQEPAGNAAPSSSTALSSRAAIPVGHGNPAFVQQLSSMVSSLEQNLVAVQEIKQAAAKQAEAQRLVRSQLADTRSPSPPPVRRSLPTLNRTQELAEEFLGSRAPTRRLQAELREQMVALRQKQSSAQALEESLSEREQQLAGRERYAPLHVHCPCLPFLLGDAHAWCSPPARFLAHCTPVPRLRRALERARSQLAGLSRSHRAGLVADGVASEEAAEGETGSRFSMERLASEDARSMHLARADDDFFF